METLGKFTVESEVWVETHQGDYSETISLDYELTEEMGQYSWNLPGYGSRGFIEGADFYETPEEAYQGAIDYTNAWATLRERELQSEYRAR